MHSMSSPDHYETEPLQSSPTISSINNDKVQMKKQLGLLEGVAIILGIILGSGIFISPKGVLQEVGSPGFSILIWVLCGLLSMLGACCYAELGTSIPKSGGDYAYIFEAFGPLPAFLYLWDAMLIFVPSTNAIMGLTFASYIIKPLFPYCDIPDSAVRLLAASAICFLTFLNCYDVKLTTRLQNVYMFTKLFSLALVILTGISWVALGNVKNFESIWEGTVKDPGKIAVAFYSGIFSYSGWNYLNFMTEELKNPYVNLPRAIYISLPLVTITYVLANTAYLAVLTPVELIASDAIAVSFADHLSSYFTWVMSVLVAISAFGGLSVHIMTSSRMCFVGARYGHFPAMLSQISINRFTPIPSLVFLMLLSLAMLCTSDVHVLITYCSIVESFFIMISVIGILYLRWKRPDMERPIKVSLWIPVVFVIVCAFLVIIPCYNRPVQVAIGILITLTGIPCFLIGVRWQSKPKWFLDMLHKTTFGLQKLFLSAKEE